MFNKDMCIILAFNEMQMETVPPYPVIPIIKKMNHWFRKIEVVGSLGSMVF